jgi:hypothetical protein
MSIREKAKAWKCIPKLLAKMRLPHQASTSNQTPPDVYQSNPKLLIQTTKQNGFVLPTLRHRQSNVRAK